ncbi:MAG: hypothetical protein ACFFBD_25340 [Candidatus Hodarchaeota archaeon]
MVSPKMLLIQLELLVVIYLVLHVLGLLFPLIKRIITVTFLPFRVLHIWLHLQIAHKLNLQNPDEDEGLMINRFITSTTGDDQTLLGIKAPKNTRDAYRIATAPTKGALVLIILSFVLSPILMMIGTIGFLIHLYILLGSLTTLWSDPKDYLFVYQLALMNVDLSPRYLGWAVPIFSISVISTLIVTSDILEALLTGVGFTVFYLVGLIWVASRIAKTEKTLNAPDSSPILASNALLPFPEVILPSCSE